MLKRIASRNILLLCACAFLGVHALAYVLLPPNSLTLVSFVFLTLAVGISFATCLRQYRDAPPDARLLWCLFTSMIFLWTCGTLRRGWEIWVMNHDLSIASYADLIFFLGGVPVVLAISLPVLERRVPVFFALDAVQVTLVAILAYLSFFTNLPFLGKASHPISEHAVIIFYAVQNFALAAGATLRLAFGPQKEIRTYFRTLTLFLWIDAVCIGTYNAAFLAGVESAYTTLLADVPFLALSIINLASQAVTLQPASQSESFFAQFIDHASPVFFTLALIVLGLGTVKAHFHIGAIVIVLAAIAYAIRVTVLQVRYMQSQRSLEEARKKLEALSLTDGLTGLANRRSFDMALEREWNRAVRDRSFLGLLMMDIDFFKKLNDHYGHAHGDECLRSVAKTLQQCVGRATDIAARYGGEEFAVILPDTNEEGTREIAERIRWSVSALAIPHLKSEIGHVTVSVGAAVKDADNLNTAEELLKVADSALYRAKQAGRNQVQTAALQVGA